jgi:hypothetical protein
MSLVLISPSPGLLPRTGSSSGTCALAFDIRSLFQSSSGIWQAPGRSGMPHRRAHRAMDRTASDLRRISYGMLFVLGPSTTHT